MIRSLCAKPQNSSLGTTFTISITLSTNFEIFSGSMFVEEIIACFLSFITLIPISLISDSSVFSIFPSRHDELLLTECENIMSASFAPFFLIFLKFVLVIIYP